ncbi:MAG: type IV pilus biogenesis protein PilM [Candidatus Velamenicoccus archaeovorus]
MLGNLLRRDFAGIYFGAKGVSFVQLSSGRIRNFLVQPYPAAEGTEAYPAEDIFESFKDREMELIAFLQKGLRDSKMEATTAVISLPPKDLIIRFFEMPNIPRSEIAAGINFEIKKYIPFKIEELAFDYQYNVKTKANIIEVILCGMKQAPLDSYSNLLQQVNFTAQAYEPGLFSLFRFLVVKGKINNQKSYVILEFNKEGANILITEKGFPYFTRDIRLAVNLGQMTPSGDVDGQMFKLINEVRVSLDYYRRQFLKKEVDEMIVISHLATSNLIDHFSKELGLKVNLLDLAELVQAEGVAPEALPDLVKAYGAALRQERPSLITLNLVRQREKAKAGGSAALSSENIQEAAVLFLAENKPALAKGGIIGVAILILGYGLGFSKLFPLEKERSLVTVQNPPVLPGVDLSSLEGVQASETQYLAQERDLRGLIDKKPMLYKKLVDISRLLPEGVWISKIAYIEDGTMALECHVYAPDDKIRQEKMNKFVTDLRNDSEFQKIFSTIQLNSWREGTLEYPTIDFDIVCYVKTA